MATKAVAAKKPASAAKAAQTLKGEVVDAETGEVVNAETSGAVGFVLPQGLKLKKLVTVPSLALKNVGQAATLRFDSAIRVSKIIDKKDTKREPAMIADVVDMSTMKPYTFIVPAVVRANLERDYDEESYVGRIFYIQNLGKRTESQRYNDYGVAELEAE